MKTIKKNFLSVAILIVLPSIFLCWGIALAANEDPSKIPLPVILSAVQIKDAENSQILVSGLMTVGYDVTIYINGKYGGIANISQITDNLTKFSYLSEPLNSNQTFEVMAVGQDKISRRLSAPTIASVRSIVEKKSFFATPSKETTKATNLSTTTTITISPPTISVTGNTTCIPTPSISGSTMSQNQVYVYVDNKLSVIIPAHEPSASISTFDYSPAGLERGQHSVYVVAQDSSGNKSTKSETLSFCVSSPQIITSTSTAAEKIEQKPTSSIVSQKTTGNDSGKQKNPLNLIIFLVFIVCLSTWMILVNKELTSEKKPDQQ